MAFLELDHVSVVFPAVQGLALLPQTGVCGGGGRGVPVRGERRNPWAGRGVRLWQVHSVPHGDAAPEAYGGTHFSGRRGTDGSFRLRGQEAPSGFSNDFPGPLRFPESPFHGVCDVEGGVGMPQPQKIFLTDEGRGGGTDGKGGPESLPDAQVSP